MVTNPSPSSARGPVAMIGASGRNSVAWTQAFLRSGFAVKTLVRNAGAQTSRPGVEYVPFDLDDRSTYEPALQSIETLALVTPPDPRQTERELGLIEAAKAAGVRRILNLSVLGADLPRPISAFARWQAPIEAALRASPFAHVTLRPNAYMQNILLQRSGIEQGRFIEPSGETASSLIDILDIADVAVIVARGGYDGEALDLTGPEALSGADIARRLSEALGRPVTFFSPPISAFRQALVDQGAPAWRVAALTELYEAVQGGARHLARVTPTVEKIVGRPPRALRDFAEGTFQKSGPPA